MTATTQLLREVTAQEVATYEEEGVVALRGIISLDWVQLLAEGIDEVFDSQWGNHDVQYDVTELASAAREMGMELLTDERAERIDRPGRFLTAISSWTYNERIRSVALDSPLREVAAALFQAAKVNFYDDELFVKQPGAKEYSAFHTDEPYYHLAGTQVCAIWISPDRVGEDNSPMRYVRGSHRWPAFYRPNSFVSQASTYDGDDREPLPDIEGHLGDYDVVTYTSEPGDVLVHHSRLVHGSGPNYSPDAARRSASFRYTGDDVRYRFQPSAPPQPLHRHELRDGDVLDSEQFPVVWTRSEAR